MIVISEAEVIKAKDKPTPVKKGINMAKIILNILFIPSTIILFYRK